jgi:phage major head subunit gpT-like protein
MAKKSTIINIGDPRSESTWKRETIDHENAGEVNFDVLEAYQEALHKSAYEANTRNFLEAFVGSPDAQNMLRDGIRYMAFSTYRGIEPTWNSFAHVMTSTREQEEYLRDSAIGTLPEVPSGTEVPELQGGFEGGALIKNKRYAGIVRLKVDDIRFDRIGKIGQVGPDLGRSGRMTEEEVVYNAITTTANYTRNVTTGDNDIGANTEALTFNGTGFEKAVNIISTARDRRSGAYLGFQPDTIIIGPRMEIPVKQLLLTGDLTRVGGNTTNEVRGTGSDINHYRGMIQRIVISPWFGTSTAYGWALVDSSVMSFVFQQLEAFNVVQESRGVTSESWLTTDSIRYLVQGYFGTGFVDDRAWFYSSSTTAPTVS